MYEQTPVSLIIPSECVLTGDERDIVYNTLVPGEFPCIGCFKSKDCSVGAIYGFATAQALGADIQPEEIKCPRCGSLVTQWSIRGQFRIWKCNGKVDVLLSDQKTQTNMMCGWAKSELGIPFSRH